MGYPDAAKECLLKRVRALGGSGWQASAEGFAAYAAASLALCRAYLQARLGGGCAGLAVQEALCACVACMGGYMRGGHVGLHAGLHVCMHCAFCVARSGR